MKKIFSVILSATIVMLPEVWDLRAYADSQPTLSMADVTANAGETVNVSVEVSNNPGIIAMSFDIEYDKSKLKLINVEDKQLLGNSTAVFGNDLSANPYKLCWDDLSETNNEENGILVDFTFEVLKGASGEAELTIIPDDSSIFNVDLIDVNFSASNGKIIINSDVEDEEIEDETVADDVVETEAVEGETEAVTSEETTSIADDEPIKDTSENIHDVLFILREYAVIQTGGKSEFIDKQTVFDTLKNFIAF